MGVALYLRRDDLHIGNQLTAFTVGPRGDTYGTDSGLDFRGATATGLPSQWRTTTEALHVFDPTTPANPFTVLVLAGLQATNPTFNPNAYVTPFGKDVLTAARTTDCFTTIAQKLGGNTMADLLHAAGTDVTFQSYPGEDHNSTMRAALPDLLAWAADRIEAP